MGDLYRLMASVCIDAGEQNWWSIAVSSIANSVHLLACSLQTAERVVPEKRHRILRIREKKTVSRSNDKKSGNSAKNTATMTAEHPLWSTTTSYTTMVLWPMKPPHPPRNIKPYHQCTAETSSSAMYLRVASGITQQHQNFFTQTCPFQLCMSHHSILPSSGGQRKNQMFV